MLAARWAHRQSTDIDFFCEAATYAELDEKRRKKLENALRTVPGIGNETLWCDPVATWCTVRDTEVTILPRPRVRALAAKGASFLESMRIELQASAEVLYGKLVRRMLQAEEVHVRDVYDVVYAAEHDRESLAAVKEFIGIETLENVAALVESLPQGWTRDQEKMLLDPKLELGERELGMRLIAALREEPGAGENGARVVEPPNQPRRPPSPPPPPGGIRPAYGSVPAETGAAQRRAHRGKHRRTPLRGNARPGLGTGGARGAARAGYGA